MDSRLVCATHEKLAEFCRKCNITRHSFEYLCEYQPALAMLKILMEWAGMVRITENARNITIHYNTRLLEMV